MEVHHHSHTSRKKWTHYFWEFLMLFLAVTLGFFVENQREHFIEHKREKQFIVTLIEDLKSDTTHLARGIETRRQKELIIDSIVLLLNSEDYSKSGSDLYYWSYSVLRPTRFFANDRTLQQLKNAGNMRLIRNLEVSDSIMAYDHQLRRLQEVISDEADIRSQFREFAKKVFNGNTLFSILDKENPAVFYRPSGFPVLIKSDAATINELLVTLQYTQHVMRVGRVSQVGLKNSASKLIEFLKKEYHQE